MNRAANKAARLKQIFQLLLAHPEGLTQADLARRLGVHRSTIHHDLKDVPGYIYEDDDGRLKVDRNANLIHLYLNLHEAMAVHLASRLLATRMDKHNPHAAAALRKLGQALARLAPRISHHVLQSADMMDDVTQRSDPVYQSVLERLTEAWATEHKVHIWHQSESNEHINEYLLSPYFVEPYAIGQTTYVIGQARLLRKHGSSSDKLFTFKIERIRQAEITSEPYRIPDEFDPRAYLSSAWGIWTTEWNPIEVVLRFTPRVARRVQESRWHPSEQTELQADGSLIWQAQIAEPKEMLPWIRGWGADCEVVRPEWLRNKLVKEIQTMAQMYGMVNRSDQNPRFFAHRRETEDRDDWQPLIDHLRNTAELAREFGQQANVAELAYVAGLVHDLGKYSAEFQKRLTGGARVDHSTAGAQELRSLFKGTRLEPLAQLLAYPIMGHHAGLPDYGDETDLEGGTVCARWKKAIPDYSAYRRELDLSALLSSEFRLHIKPHPKNPGFSFSFLVRMVFSALVDADFQETETYMQGKRPRGNHASIETLCQRLDAFLEQFKNPTSEINRKRNETLHACIKQGEEQPPGFFSLTIPTGGGKTLASIAFALHHAVKYGLRRIIYVIPFTTIIEQNAAVFKNIFGEENVLEHHSNFDWQYEKLAQSGDPTLDVLTKLKLAAENWDIPIVVTTNVQFFESLFANTPSRCRKLHNIARSVIIFDEAQMLPREYMRPAMAAIWELVTNYGASTVFCTATQPNLERFLPEGTHVRELAPNPQALFTFYKRVDIQHLGTLTDEELLKRLSSHEQALCIVNTRRHASGLFKGLQGEGNYHLSTLMCPAHRSEKLAEIRERLNREQSCRVISTTVMEAGVDLDFPVGYRALAGLDSINQAAGRVNREMRRGICQLFIFDPQSALIKRIPSFLKQSAEVARMVLRSYAKEPISVAAVETFFNQLYDFQDPNISFDVKRIMEHLSDETGRFDFATVSEHFRIIDDDTVPIIIPFHHEVMQLIDDLRHSTSPALLLRKLQPYTVPVYEREFEQLSSKGVILTINDSYHVLDPDQFSESYDLQQGLLIPDSNGGDGLLF